MKLKLIKISLFITKLTITADISAQEPVQPIFPIEEINLAKAELGKKLFFDPRLSKSGTVSCNSCHNLSFGGTDNLKTSIGHLRQPGPLNSPTVFNSSFSIAQFWDGRAVDLKEQAMEVTDPPENMQSEHSLTVNVLQSIPAYKNEFKRVFASETIDLAHVTLAISEFLKTLVTPYSRFDKWWMGENVLNELELNGYLLFKKSGCKKCHNGPALGGKSFQKMGLVKPYKTSNNAEGLSAVTGKETDYFKFKVPTLRNIEMTYPYFHDGEIATLSKAVDIMGNLQLGKQFSDLEIKQIVAFLKTLTGNLPLIKIPILPALNNKSAGQKKK